jgi:hypothetical protein
MGKQLEHTVSKDGVEINNVHMKKYSTSLDIKEMQIKITLRFHFTPGRLAIIQKIARNAGKDGKGRGRSPFVGGNENKSSHEGNQAPQEIEN